MTSRPSAIPVGFAASPLFLREAELRRGFELLTFGAAQLGRVLDPILAEQGLGRAHHRALYFIGRQPGLSIGTLLRLLSITKQSLGRVLSDLIDHDLVERIANEEDRRQKLLRLTAAGATLDTRLFEALGEPLRAAYQRAGQDAVSGFWQVLDGLIPLAERGLLHELMRAR